MIIPKVAGIETEYAVTIIGSEESDPFLASQLVLNAYGRIGGFFVPCEPDSSSRGTRRNTVYTTTATFAENQKSSLLPLERVQRPTRRKSSTDLSDLMLSNGARLYIDHAHPEYSTPECLSPRLLLTADKAGEHILAACQRRLNAVGTLPPGQNVRLYKNNSDYKGNSYGCHENYLLSAHLFDGLLHWKTHQVFRYVLPFFITRTILCGSGKVGSEHGTVPVGFQLSQRADFFETLMGLQTTYERPLFNTRDEAHADRARYRRLHVITGDANMADYSTYLKIGMTQLFLQMLEDDFIREDFTLAEPLQSMQTVSRDLTFKQSLMMEDGRVMSALDIQYAYLERAHAYLTAHSGNEEQWQVFQIWEDALDMLPDHWELLATRFDWAIKKRLLDRFLSGQGATWEDIAAWQPIIEMPGPIENAKAWAEQSGLAWGEYDKQHELYFALRRLHLEYHDIRHNAELEETGLFYRLQQRGAVERLITDEEVEDRTKTAVPDTRSWMRGQCIARFPNSLVSADWSILHFQLSNQEVYLSLPDPLSETREDTTLFWQNMERPVSDGNGGNGRNNVQSSSISGENEL